jgi:hypothetical protein
MQESVHFTSHFTTCLSLQVFGLGLLLYAMQESVHSTSHFTTYFFCFLLQVFGLGLLLYGRSFPHLILFTHAFKARSKAVVKQQ